ncbi:hypothetical protein P280DRAFT_249958 [Massarina eburnea CBS 473.64]|uniref:Uncharacterized protein n=1 Tax=Massarina eburnea CBS 473.64 TaxID=1395130 RepID=A0A6A6S7Z1_9PLEO|nr:hypothetical protein P280DRAFT_249958 [Massarina eburnea CBS 473.64]
MYDTFILYISQVTISFSLQTSFELQNVHISPPKSLAYHSHYTPNEKKQIIYHNFPHCYLHYPRIPTFEKRSQSTNGSHNNICAIPKPFPLCPRAQSHIPTLRHIHLRTIFRTHVPCLNRHLDDGLRASNRDQAMSPTLTRFPKKKKKKRSRSRRSISCLLKALARCRRVELGSLGAREAV